MTVQHVVRDDYCNDDIERLTNFLSLAMPVDFISRTNWPMCQATLHWPRRITATWPLPRRWMPMISMTNCSTSSYLNAEWILDVGTRNERKGRVVKRAKGVKVDSDGNQSQLRSEITDHRFDNSAIQTVDGFLSNRNGIVSQSLRLAGGPSWSLGRMAHPTECHYST